MTHVFGRGWTAAPTLNLTGNAYFFIIVIKININIVYSSHI